MLWPVFSDHSEHLSLVFVWLGKKSAPIDTQHSQMELLSYSIFSACSK